MGVTFDPSAATPPKQSGSQEASKEVSKETAALEQAQTSLTEGLHDLDANTMALNEQLRQIKEIPKTVLRSS